jgi:hypothetical protein
VGVSLDSEAALMNNWSSRLRGKVKKEAWSKYSIFSRWAVALQTPGSCPGVSPVGLDCQSPDGEIEGRTRGAPLAIDCPAFAVTSGNDKQFALRPALYHAQATIQHIMIDAWRQNLSNGIVVGEWAKRFIGRAAVEVERVT